MVMTTLLRVVVWEVGSKLILYFARKLNLLVPVINCLISITKSSPPDYYIGVAARPRIIGDHQTCNV